MPELPEVETVARLVRPGIEGRTITGARVSWERSLGGAKATGFRRSVRGARIARVWRRAKFIVCDLEREGAPAGHLTCHLRMTGRLRVDPLGTDVGDYLRVALELDGRDALSFIDVRKFGRFTFEEDLERRFEKLGPEPLSDEFTHEVFRSGLRRRRRMLKPLLLDQEFVAGLGNIYVDEALHRARLHPLRRSDKIDRRASERLHGEIRTTLEEAIEREGSSFDTFYRTPEGQPGSYQHQFRVYGRGGKPCRTCGREIERIVVSQRGTHLCRRCQPAPRAR